MDLRTELHYPATPDEVFAMLSDETFVARKAAATGALSHEADVDEADGRVTVHLRRVMPPHVPDFVRRFVGDTVDLEQVDVWEPAGTDGTRRGTFTVKIAGAPVSVNGTLRLAPGDSGTVETVEATVKASIPFVGGKVEQSVHDAVLLAARKENEVGKDWLAGSGG